MIEGHMVSDELLEQAADWFMRVRGAPVDSDVHTAWLRWIEADPAHRAAFAEIQETWDVVGKVESPPWPKPEELQGPALTRLRRFTWPAIAASVVVAVGVTVLSRFEILSDRHADSSRVHTRITTGRGEQQSAVLPDGSRVELGGLTGVELAFTPERRLIIADEGEVFYRVEHDPTRPFVVQAGPVHVTAVGTAFSVRREGDAVSVVVTEGVVQVDADTARHPAAQAAAGPVRAKAGERVRFDHGQLAPTAQPLHIEPVGAAWRRGQLRFEEEPLRVVVASLNRYSTKQIVIGDSELEELRFTGTIFDDSVDHWLSGVQVVFPVKLNQSEPGRVILERRN